MGATGAMMAVSAGAQGASSVGGAISQSEAMKAQGEYASAQAKFNSKLSEFSAADAISRGDVAASKQKTLTKGIVGSQRAAYASQGIDVDTGSAAEVQSDTHTMGALDALTIKNNAWREAWGYKMSGLGASYQGQNAAASANFNANNTLLTGGMQAVSSGMQAGYYGSGGGKK